MLHKWRLLPVCSHCTESSVYGVDWGQAVCRPHWLSTALCVDVLEASGWPTARFPAIAGFAPCPCPGWAWHVVMRCDSYANIFFPSWKLFFSLSLKGWVSLCQFGHVRVFLPQCGWMRRDSSRTVADLLLWHCHWGENTCKLESPPQNVSTGTKVLVTQKKKQDDWANNSKFHWWE